MDARKQADALLGMDHALRHFIIKLNPAFKGIDFEIPVKVREGSWEALIPETVSGWVQASLGIAATAYLTQAAQKMAERDFDEFGVRDIFSKALSAINGSLALESILAALKPNHLKTLNLPTITIQSE